MKTKKECLLVFEYPESEFKNITFPDIKKKYRNLTARYNTDNGSEKNEDKHREIIECFNLLRVYYQQSDEKFSAKEIESTEVDIIQESGGLFSGQIYAVDYKNNCSCMIWSPHWRSETDNNKGVGIIGYAYCTEIKMIEYNMIPLFRKSIIIASKIPTNTSQSNLESILLKFGIKLMNKKKTLDSPSDKITEQATFNF